MRDAVVAVLILTWFTAAALYGVRRRLKEEA